MSHYCRIHTTSEYNRIMKKTLRRTLKVAGSIIFLFVLALVIHIYIAMKPRITERSIVMARIDFKQDINTNDASRITAWLYSRKGVSHVLCNPEGNCVVFTYYPIKADAGKLAQELNQSLHYNGTQYIPTEADLAKGCPVSRHSFTYKVYSFFKNII